MDSTHLLSSRAHISAVIRSNYLRIRCSTRCTYVPFTQLNQAIPSPWGMPDFILNFETYESVATPDFSGERVKCYHKLIRFCSRLKCFDRAFPPPKDSEDDSPELAAPSIFNQCPDSFSRGALDDFTTKCRSKEGRKLFSAAKALQANAVRR